ncbi:ABC-type multidrug transport system ATPase component [Methanonatronarchaeum thermophilum]|uniref:ABC-type multidrug transport system ATPase component n=1 Tax=Methanonatronarchaeum thermophilum TaxID=1927129 RepID=A0A1Y3GAF5_9EURY|nr:ATP-binding cassette domain-containing protein [Methanonatronarchaeum thermophilum]OUJ18247.1 ABC-type multidrug transport system ATPase component [Methanonatronarchaeum thermophilum]
MIEVQNLHKRYDNIHAVDNISFNVKDGEIFGLLGPNGAGKTTTIGMLTTEIRPTDGDVNINGLNVVKNPLGVKMKIGVVPQHRSLDKKLSGRENISIMARAYGVKNRKKQIDDVLRMVGLHDRGDDNIKEYSGGMLQRLLIARALIHEPDIIFLDEPTMGLDPHARRSIWQKIIELNERGKTMVLTTHYMEEADALCDRVAIMNEGKIVGLDSPENLKKKGPAENVIKIGLDDVHPELIEKLNKITGVKKIQTVEGARTMELHIYAEKGEELSPILIDEIKTTGLTIHSLDIRKPTLEDVFISLTGEKLG